MSRWLPEFSLSHRAQLVLVAGISAGLAVSATFGLQRARRKINIHDLKESIPSLNEKHDIEKVCIGDLVTHETDGQQINNFGGADSSTTESREDQQSAALARRARLGDYDEELILEQLARNRVFLQDDGLKKLRKAFVIVVGCGGVGSHAAAALARSGCGRIRLIDFDQVTLSSLNRHAVATLADVGTPKVDCLRKRLEQVVPWIEFDCKNQLFGEKVADEQLCPWVDGQGADFVIDAIDNIESKVALLHYCHRHDIKVISSMGAGCKSDPTRVFISDISASTDDPLSKATRRKLRMLGVKDGIPVVFSSEKPGPGKAQLLPLSEEEFQKGKVNELGVLPDFRVRILPVLGTMPAVFGLCVANHVMLAISGYPHEYIVGKSREKMYDGILAQLQGSEEKLIRQPGQVSVGLRVPISIDDVSYLVDEVFHGRSVVSGLTARLGLVRWRKPQGLIADTSTPGQKASLLRTDELVCMTKDELQQHEKLVLFGDKTPEQLYNKDVIALVERRLKEDEAYKQWR